MPDDVIADVTPASSPGSPDQSPATGQAPTTPESTAANGQPPGRTVPLETFIAERRGWQARAAEHERRALEMEQRLQGLEAKRDRGEALTPEQEVERRQALVALKQLFGADDELKPLLDLAKNAKGLLETSQGVSRLTETQQQANLFRARSHVTDLAKGAGLPNDAKFLTRLTRLVAMEAQNIPDADRRFDAGDYTVLDEAFEAVKGDFASARREAVASLAQTKQQLQRTVPPRPAGGASGPAAPPKLEAGKERQFWEGAMSRMRERVRGAGEE